MSRVPSTSTCASADTLTGSDLGSKLCTQCGLCCTGAIHDAAVLDQDEIPAAKALGLAVRESEKPAFALPCPRLSGSMCTIYGNRPRVCGRYKCQLLHDLEDGETSFEDAVAKVEIAKELFAQAKAAIPPTMTLSEARRRALRPPSADAQKPDIDMNLRLRLTAMSLYLDQNFRNGRDGKLYALTVIGDISPEMEGK